MTAALTFLPKKSEAEEASRLMWRLAISETVTVVASSDSVSCIENATVLSCFMGCAEAWQGVGSIESKLKSGQCHSVGRKYGVVSTPSQGNL